MTSQAPISSKRKRPCGWDDPDDRLKHVQTENQQQSLVAQQQLLLLKRQISPLKKVREVYCGNLAAGVMTVTILRDHFNKLFMMIPEYLVKYGDTKEAGVVRDVKLSTDGTYGFVEFWTEELTLTALEMDRHDCLGRSMRIGRPSGFVDPGLLIRPLDVSPLRQARIIPPVAVTQSDVNGDGSAGAESRAVVIDGFSDEMGLDEESIKDLLHPACSILQYELGLSATNLIPRIEFIHADQALRVRVEFHSSSFARMVKDCFDGISFLDRILQVERPTSSSSIEAY